MDCMEENENFEYANDTYFQMFGPSNMDAFFQGRPEQTKARIKWSLKRAMTYFFVIFCFPTWLTIQTTGIIFGRKAELEEVAFAIAYGSFLFQTVFKIVYFLVRLKDFRELCLNFQEFNTSRHRPGFAKSYLQETSNFLRKISKTFYSGIYLNLLLWNVSPLLVEPFRYILRFSGYLEEDTSALSSEIIPVVFAFDVRASWYLRATTGLLEWLVVNGGLVYTVTMELFFMSLFLMLAGEMEVICKATENAKELRTSLGRDYTTLLGPGDVEDRISMSLLIEDHQNILMKMNKLSKIMDPILGVAVCYRVIVLPTVAIITLTVIRSADSVSAAVSDSANWIASTMLELLTLYLYSWICGRLKDSEEAMFEAIYSTNWYERDKDYRNGVLVIMGKSLMARKMKMLSCGEMDRTTFLAGLRGIYSFYNFILGFK